MEKEEKMTPELARMHAHLCGDGCVYQYKTSEKDRINRAGIGYYNNNQKLLEKFRKDFSKIFNVKMYLKENKFVIVKSIKIYDYLIARFGSFHSKVWRISDEIKEANNEIKIEWLKAFFEDEAYHEKRYNRMKIKSVNLSGLRDAKELLDSMNIFSNITGPNCDESFYLTIPRFDSVKEFNGFSKEPARQ